MNLPKEWPEKGIKYMQEGHNKDRKGYTDGYNQCWEDCTAALEAVVEEAKREERKRLSDNVQNEIWNKDGLLKSHDISHIVSVVGHQFLDANKNKTITPPTDVTDN